MSRTSTSLDLSDFFNNDDSGGHRLAEFLQKRRGGAQGQNFLFMNCEPQRLSLNVQLEELPPLQQNSDSDKQTKNLKNHDKSKETVTLTAAPEKQNLQNLNYKDLPPSKSDNGANNEVPKHNPLLSDKPVSPISPIRPLSSIANVSPSRPPNTLKPITRSRPISPRLSASKRTRGVPPSDRLRRRSLSRRFLLQEFESTIGDFTFDPSTCSTPFSQPEKQPLASPSQSSEIENFEPNISGKINGINDSCCCHTDTVIKNLQRKDEEFKMYMENILENTLQQIRNDTEKEKCKSPADEDKTNKTLQSTKSPLKRTYTVEKGSFPGQVVLTPDKNTSVQITHQKRLLRSQKKALPSKILTRAQRRLNNSQRFNNLSSRLDEEHNYSRKSANMKNESRSTVLQQTSLPNIASHRQEVHSSLPQRNVSILFPTQDVEIAEIQESGSNGLQVASSNSIIIQANTGEIPLVVIPFNSTHKRNYSEEISAQQRQKTPEASANQCYQHAEDNLKLTDILTDDDDDIPNSSVFRTIKNDSPLNLAASSTNIRKTRMRTRKMLKEHNSQLLSNETEKELPPKAHSGRAIAKRKHIPLNKAPGTPLNGERFAQELARMSNYEILDLRKRNSMGKIFAISGRKSRKSYQEVVKNQLHLEKKIETELLKRNMDEATNEKTNKGYQEDIAEEEINEYLPVPDEFRDSLSKLKDRNDSTNSSFIDEKSSDRISFKKREDKSRLSKNKKQLPEVLKQYLEGQSDMEENNNLMEDDILKEPTLSNMTRSQTILCVASPPKSDNKQMTTPKAVSPPPIVSYSFKKSTTRHQHQNTLNVAEENLHDTHTVDVNCNKTLLPPPPGFETDSDFSSNNTHINTITTFQTNKTITPKTNQNYNTDDEHVFKKPVGRPPKSRVQRQRESKDLVQSSTELQQFDDNSTNTTSGTLRRSKRGHVPLTHPVPIFQLMFEQTLNKRMLLYEKRKLKEKKKLRENRDSNSLQSSQNSTKVSKISKKRDQISTMPENGGFNDYLQRESKILKNKKATHAKIRNRKQNKNAKKQVQPAENFESSRIIMATPPPVDYLNNVFDQLRNTSLAPTTLKVKPFKVRVARLKSSEQQNTSAPVSVTSSSINKNSNYELISWLKNISESDNSYERNAIFKEMRISAASNLSFTELQGVEYAFYETEDKASLGYLRFKPRQVKPKKKAKRFHLHFVTLEGNFRITANDKESIIGVGDMVAIEKSVYYDIQNITDDIGILMVIKK